MRSYLRKSTTRDHNISYNDHLKPENNFWKKVQIENFDQVLGFVMERLI